MGGWTAEFCSNAEDGSKVYLIGHVDKAQEVAILELLKKLNASAMVTSTFAPVGGVDGPLKQLRTGKKGVSDLFKCQFRTDKKQKGEVPRGHDGTDRTLKPLPYYIGFRVAQEDSDVTLEWLKSMFLCDEVLQNVFWFGRHAIEAREPKDNDAKLWLTEPKRIPDPWSYPRDEVRCFRKSFKERSKVVKRLVKTPNPDWLAAMRDAHGKLLPWKERLKKMRETPFLAPYHVKTVREKRAGYVVHTDSFAQTDRAGAEAHSERLLAQLDAADELQSRQLAKAAMRTSTGASTEVPDDASPTDEQAPCALAKSVSTGSKKRPRSDDDDDDDDASFAVTSTDEADYWHLQRACARKAEASRAHALQQTKAVACAEVEEAHCKAELAECLERAAKAKKLEVQASNAHQACRAKAASNPASETVKKAREKRDQKASNYAKAYKAVQKRRAETTVASRELRRVRIRCEHAVKIRELTERCAQEVCHALTADKVRRIAKACSEAMQAQQGECTAAVAAAEKEAQEDRDGIAAAGKAEDEAAICAAKEEANAPARTGAGSSSSAVVAA